jgi:hypothetical protein
MTNPEIDLFTDFWCPPAAYLFRRTIVERIGGFNEGLPVIQDARFALDCAIHGARFVYTPGVMAYYRVHQNGSVSTRNPLEFVRDCFRNAIGVEEIWRNTGRLNDQRCGVLVKVYGGVARASYENDPETFESCYQSILRLVPKYHPTEPKSLAWASRLLGYRGAEALALRYRRMKRRFRFPKTGR